MKALQRMLIIFASSLIAARLADMFLRSGTGKQVVQSAGLHSLLTEEGADTARRYSKTAVGLLVGTALTLRAHRADQKKTHENNWIGTAEDAAELAMAAGALAKIVADFLREEQRIRHVRA